MPESLSRLELEGVSGSIAIIPLFRIDVPPALALAAKPPPNDAVGGPVD